MVLNLLCAFRPFIGFLGHFGFLKSMELRTGSVLSSEPDESPACFPGKVHAEEVSSSFFFFF